MIKPFLVGLPRSRSTILHYKMEGYANNVLNLHNINLHPEYFLDFSITDLYLDTKTDVKEKLELYPKIKNETLELHFIWPPVFQNSKERIDYKLNLLQEEKKNGREYYLKGSINIFSNYKNVLDFFSDRKIILTKRRDIVEMVISFVFAKHIKLFHAKADTIDRYQEILKTKQVIPVESLENIDSYISELLFVNNVENYLSESSFNYKTLYYEELDTSDKIDNAISEILETDIWKKYSAKTISTPIEVKKQYTELIENYKELYEFISNKIK